MYSSYIMPCEIMYYNTLYIEKCLLSGRYAKYVNTQK